MTRLAWALLAMAQAPPAPAPEVAVRAPAAARCSLQDAAGRSAPARLAASAPGRWSWKRLPGDVLACDAPGLEPVDVDPGRAALPPEMVLEMPPARAVTLEGRWAGIEAVVEWRALAEPRTALLARRTLRITDRLTLPVATRARVLRLRPAGASPVSLFLAEGSGPASQRLPPPAPGGEVFGRIPSHAFSPATLELSAGGRTLVVEPDSRRVFRASGLAPGAALLVPLYRGGVRGRAVRLAVPAGQSLELLPLDLPEPGALSLTAAAEACAPEHLPARLQVRRVGEGAALAPAVVDRPVDGPPCEQEVEGLEEGEVEAALVRATGPGDVLALARGRVSPGRRLALTLHPPEVRVSGRVSFGADRPAAGFGLTFELEEQRWTTLTDENGEYSLALGSEGEYGLAVRTAAGLPSASFSRRFRKGAQQADFKLAETAVSVRIRRADGAPVDEAVQLALTSREGRRLTTSWQPASEGEALFAGIEQGEYWVTGTTASGLASSSTERVELTALLPAAEAELVLDRFEGQLRVVDEAGQPLPAQALGGESPLVAQGRGSFRVAGVAMGERLRVMAPGYVPVCRRLQPQDLPELRVVLPVATERLTIHFAADLPWGSGLLLGLPGSDCPIEISELEFAEQTGAERTTVVLRVPRGRFQFSMGSGGHPVATGSEAYIREIAGPGPPR